MKETFKEINLRQKSLDLIEHCNDIIKNYQDQGLKLTLRQLYYQLVTQNIITNEERSYKNLSTVVSDARLGGYMDWDAIEDRVRQPRMQSEFRNLRALVEAALYSYRLPRWQDQEVYAELWVEKDALAGVLSPLAREYHVTMMVNRGYSSQSAMYDSASRFIDARRPGVLFYLGDHDPSGEDMVRDIRDRLEMFGCQDLQVEKLALTMEQVRKHQPPPNPAKITDPRAAEYIREHGNKSWEVDALRPELLTRIIRSAFRAIIDDDKLEAIKEQETKDKDFLRSAVAHIE